MATTPEVPVGTVVDSNVILDVIGGTSEWAAWSGEALARQREVGALVINPIIYSEVSIGFDTVEAVDSALPDDLFTRAEIPWPAAFLAGKAFLAYRRRGGERRSPLPDFFIGAHAAVANLTLLTRDPARYRTYYPRLEIVAPN